VPVARSKVAVGDFAVAGRELGEDFHELASLNTTPGTPRLSNSWPPTSQHRAPRRDRQQRSGGGCVSARIRATAQQYASRPPHSHGRSTSRIRRTRCIAVNGRSVPITDLSICNKLRFLQRHAPHRHSCTWLRPYQYPRDLPSMCEYPVRLIILTDIRVCCDRRSYPAHWNFYPSVRF
jgi:hypothetical protein